MTSSELHCYYIIYYVHSPSAQNVTEGLAPSRRTAQTKKLNGTTRIGQPLNLPCSISVQARSIKQNKGGIVGKALAGSYTRHTVATENCNYRHWSLHYSSNYGNVCPPNLDPHKKRGLIALSPNWLQQQ